MDYIPENSLLKFHEDTLDSVRRAYNLHRPGEMVAAVNILAGWARQQNHFIKKDYSIEYLERCIIQAKGSVERAKTRLDKLCTMKTLLPYCFVDYSLKSDFEQYEDIRQAIYALIPQLTSDHFRVAVLKHAGSRFSRKITLNVARITFMILEYLRIHDYCKGYILILDLTGLNVSEGLSVANLTEIKEMIDIYRGGYDTRLKAIHVISTSKVIDVAVNIFKQFANAKVSARMHVHSHVDTVYNFVEKDVLPKDYGGNEKPLTELHERWVEIMSHKETRQYLNITKMSKTDEAKRTPDKFNDLYMGVSGTFRNLVVD